MDESQFETLCELEKDGTLSQRDLSRKIGLSLGRVNYLINGLLEKWYIKAERFKNSKKKIGYTYVITSNGVSEKFQQTQRFLQRKTEEYERLKGEVELLRKENGDTPWQKY